MNLNIDFNGLPESIGLFNLYVIGINGLGFILFAINTWLYRHTAKGQIDSIITIVSILGGCAGILLAIMLFDHSTNKEILMSRVFIVCTFITQLIIFLVIKGYHSNDLNLAFWNLFIEHKWVFVYLCVINFVTIIIYALDKIRAVENKSRIENVKLLALAFMGGCPGALLSMFIFRHKIRKDYYVVGVPLILLMQVTVLIYVINI